MVNNGSSVTYALAHFCAIKNMHAHMHTLHHCKPVGADPDIFLSFNALYVSCRATAVLYGSTGMPLQGKEQNQRAG